MSDSPTAWKKAITFKKLHVPGNPIVLPNAWDPVTARVIASAGAHAIATTSAAMSWAHGRPDGNNLSRFEAIQAIARIVQCTDLPVTADIEAGYGKDDNDLAVTLRGLLDAGVIGINIEDSVGEGQPLREIGEATRRVQVARAVASERGIPMYVNARIDTYVGQPVDAADRLDETFRRAEAYLAAGASGIFVPYVLDLSTIEQLVQGIDAPVNILGGPNAPTVSELADAGVARVSTGSSLATATLGFLRAAAAESLEGGTFERYAENVPYAELNGYFPDTIADPKHFQR